MSRIIKNLAHILVVNYNDSNWSLINDDYDRLEWNSDDDKPSYEDLLQYNNQTGDSNNEQEQEQSAGSGDSGGDASGESSGQDSGGVEADSSDSSSSTSGASEASESSSDDGS